MINGVGIPCGQNPAVLGSIVDGNTRIDGELKILFYGDINFGPLIKIKRFYGYENPVLRNLWEEYESQITDGAHLYLVERDAFSGTIYACGHSVKGEWTVYAKTTGYVE